MISGPRPAPALSEGSIFNNNTFVPGSIDEGTPTLYLKAFLLPVDPYRKFLSVESLKSSENEWGADPFCPLAVSAIKPATADIISCFIYKQFTPNPPKPVYLQPE